MSLHVYAEEVNTHLEALHIFELPMIDLVSNNHNVLKHVKTPPKVFLAGHHKALESLRILQKIIQKYYLFIPPVLWKYRKGFPILIGGGVYYNGSNFKFPKIFRAEERKEFITELFVDSGAQQFYNKFKDFSYPYSPRKYVETIIRHITPDYLATMDLPLDILVPRGLSIKEGIRKTVEYGVDNIYWWEKIVGEGYSTAIVPTLQGYNNPNQWLESIDLYYEHGITPKRFRIWGIGSLCMTNSYKFVKRVLESIREKLGTQVKIHVFGLSLHVLRKVWRLIDNYDTSAWVYWAKMDGALFFWFPRLLNNGKEKNRFTQWVARRKKSYSTEEIMAVNAINLLIHNYTLPFFD